MGRLEVSLRDGELVLLGRHVATKATDVDAVESFVSSQPDHVDTDVDAESLRAARAQQLRRAAVPISPTTPLHFNRQAGGVVGRGLGRYSGFSSELLRRIRDRSPIIQAIHAARHAQLRRLARPWSGKPGDVGWRIVHKDFHDPHIETPARFKDIIERAKAMFCCPDARDCKTTGELFVQAWEDYATINRPVVEPLWSMLKPDWCVGWTPVDGALIWPTMRWVDFATSEAGRLLAISPDAPPAVRMAAISRVLGMDLETCDFVLVREGIPEIGYPKRNKLLVAPFKSRTDVRYAGWPPSILEQATLSALSHLNAWNYNDGFFTKGLMSEIIIAITGADTDEDVDAFADMLREAGQGVDHAHQPPIMSMSSKGKVEVIPLKPNAKDMGFEGWMSMTSVIQCATYRIHPSTISLKPWDPNSGATLSEASRDHEIDLANEEGLQGDMQHLVDSIFNPMIAMVNPDLRVIIEYGGFDAEKAAKVDAIHVETTQSRNQIRMRNGEPPMDAFTPPDKWDSASDEEREEHRANPWNWPADSTFAGVMMAKLGLSGKSSTDEGDGEEEQEPASQKAKPPKPRRAASAKASVRPSTKAVLDTPVAPTPRVVVYDLDPVED